MEESWVMTPFQREVLQFIRESKGVSLTTPYLAKHFSQPTDKIRTTLNTLYVHHMVERNVLGNRSYWFVS